MKLPSPCGRLDGAYLNVIPGSAGASNSGHTLLRATGLSPSRKMPQRSSTPT
jgi:hypothetical protein